MKSLILTTLVLAAANVGAQNPIRLEAEDATLVGTAVTTGRAGFSGKGYVSGMDRKTDRIVFKVEAPAGLYDLAIRYSSPFGNKGYVLDVAGLKVSGMFQPTENVFVTHRAGVIELPGGPCELAIEYGWGYYDVDYLELTPAAKPAPPAKPPATLCDPKATPAAKALMADLVNRYGTGTLSGVQCEGDFDYVKKIADRTAAILGDDLMDYTPSRVERGAKPKKFIERMITEARQGSRVTLVWHWNAPNGLEKSTTNTQGKVSTEKWWSGFYTKATTFDVQKALADPQSEDYKLLLRDIDAIAVPLRTLADADVPVLWRPLHEAEGGWFWWGAKGPESFIKLWRLMHQRLTEHHNLHHLVWVFTGSANPQWYPGDDVVDIVGLDSYPEDRRDTLSGDWQSLQQRYGGKKLLALTEFGGVPDIEHMQKLGIWWSYFVSWTGTSGPKGMKNEDLVRIYHHPGVLNREVTAPTK